MVKTTKKQLLILTETIKNDKMKSLVTEKSCENPQ